MSKKKDKEKEELLEEAYMYQIEEEEEEMEEEKKKEDAPDVKPAEKKKEEKKGQKDEVLTAKEIEEFHEWQAEKKRKEEEAKRSPQVTMRQDAMKNLRKQWEEESKMVTGIFRCHQPKGGGVKFPFYKYPWDELKWYEMVDGCIYTVPLSVARHLRNNCAFEVHATAVDPETGQPLVTVGRREDRMSFESNEFATL